MPSFQLDITLKCEKKTVPRNNSGYLAPKTKSSNFKYSITTSLEETSVVLCWCITNTRWNVNCYVASLGLSTTAVTTQLRRWRVRNNLLYMHPHSSGKYVIKQGNRLKATDFNASTNWKYIAVTRFQHSDKTARPCPARGELLHNIFCLCR